MANYLACVELGSAGAEDYELLHRLMELRGFTRKITGEDGVTYLLPAGSYFVAGPARCCRWLWVRRWMRLRRRGRRRRYW